MHASNNTYKRYDLRMPASALGSTVVASMYCLLPTLEAAYSIAVLVPSSLGVLLNRIKLRLIRSVPVSDDDDRHGISNQ